MGNPALSEARVVLVGFPVDEGVRRNGGRVGAAAAPDTIRRQLYKLTPDARHDEPWRALLAATLDAGNLIVSGDLARDQQHLGQVVAEIIDAGAIPVILGGGHETAYGHFLGYASRGICVHIVNVDAHADVRPLKDGRGHSGSPFFQALEHESKCCAGYDVLGLAPWAVSRAHLAYLEDKGCRYHWLKETSLQALASVFDALEGVGMATLDMDVVAQEEAPGTSAPATIGMPLATFCHAAYLAGRTPGIASVDLVEVNPALDLDYRTSRAAALTVWHLLSGVTNRS